MFEKDCFDVYQPDATFAGGIAQVKQVMDACRSQDLLFTPYLDQRHRVLHQLEHGPHSENNLPLEYPLEEPSWVPEFREGIIEPILPGPNSMLKPFTRPGLGFEIDKGS